MGYAGSGSVAVEGDTTASFYPSVHDNGYYDVTVAYSTRGAADVRLTVNGRAISGLSASKEGIWASTARVHLAKGVSEIVLASPAGIDLASLTTTRAVDGDASTVTIEAEDA